MDRVDQDFRVIALNLAVDAHKGEVADNIVLAAEKYHAFLTATDG